MISDIRQLPNRYYGV